MNPLAEHVYVCNNIPTEISVDCALLVLNERLITSKNVIMGLELEINRLKAIQLEFEEYKKKERESKLR